MKRPNKRQPIGKKQASQSWLGAYWERRREFNGQLKVVTDSVTVDKTELEKLHYLEQLKDALLWKTVCWYILLPLTIIIVIGSVILLLPVRETVVAVDLRVSSLSLRTHGQLKFNSSAFPNRIKGKLNINGSIESPAIKEISGDEIELIPRVGSGLITLESFELQDSSWLELTQVLSGNLNITSKNKADTSKLSDPPYWIFSAVNTELTQQGKLLHHFGALEAEMPHTITIATSAQDIVSAEMEKVSLELPPFYFKGIDFTEPAEDQQAHHPDSMRFSSSIRSGKLRFLDTENDSLNLEMGDSLALHFINEPVRTKINSDSLGIRVRFNARLRNISAATQVYSTKLESKMPQRYRTLFEYQSLFWAFIASVVPALVTIVLGAKRQLR